MAEPEHHALVHEVIGRDLNAVEAASALSFGVV
jgi:hypothetical protein